MNAILDEYRRMQKGSENVAKALTAIKDGELWRDDFDTFEQCIDTFGIGKAQAYRVISSYKMKYNEEHDGRLENYTLSQVAEIAITLLRTILGFVFSTKPRCFSKYIKGPFKR